MTSASATWGSGIGLSLAAHLAAAGLLAVMLQPDPITDQPQPKSQLTIETQDVTRSQAKADAPQATQTVATSGQGAHLDQGQVPQSRAKAATVAETKVAAADLPQTVAPPDRPPDTRIAALAAPPDTRIAALAVPPPVKAVTAATAVAQPVVLAAPAVKPTPSVAPIMKATAAVAPVMQASVTDTAVVKADVARTPIVQASLADSPRIEPVEVTAATARPQDLSALAAPVAAVSDPAPTQAAAQPDAAAAVQSAPNPQPAVAAPTDGTHMTAALAWSGDKSAQIDAQSLKAIQSFMRPGDTAAASDEVHDGMSAILASVPCARLQAEFNPETGHLDLRGHVPDEAMRGPVLKALQAQLGSAIQVDDAMLILPRPQCGALAGIADVGLPQSQDQLTNPRLIGADAQAKAYTYSTGQTMILDLAAPDYDAYLYVDFFDADGNVIHLVPNDTVPLKLRPAKTAMRVGASDAGEPFLNITIGPPYGQEIAAAFAASAPLYDGLRPFSEPATLYLDWLKTRVAAARKADPGFKGEWVYFFVSTRQK